MDQPNDAAPSSPSISSISSSDLDTESTGSFFHDRSTSLGTLMGVTLRISSRRENNAVAGGGSAERSGRPRPERRRGLGRRWWRLWREENRVPSLADFLEMERRLGDVSEQRFLYGGAPPEGYGLFADGRVLPPAGTVPAQSPAWSVCRISGICCGGV